MKILVGYKRVVDYNVRIQVKPDGTGVVTDGVKLSANPFDDIALEEALRLREKGVATEVIVVGIGPADLTAHLRNGFLMKLVIEIGTVIRDDDQHRNLVPCRGPQRRRALQEISVAHDRDNDAATAGQRQASANRKPRAGRQSGAGIVAEKVERTFELKRIARPAIGHVGKRHLPAAARQLQRDLDVAGGDLGCAVFTE